MRALLDSIVEQLLARHRAIGRVDLNDIAEVIGTRPVTYEEVEHIIARLETEGLRVGEPLTHSDVARMRHIIVTAHRLRAKLSRRPTIDEIAADSGHPPYAVRRALETGRRAARVR